MEEPVLLRQVLRRLRRERVRLPSSVSDLKPHVIRRRRVLQRPWQFRPDERGTPCVGDEFLVAVGFGVEEVFPPLFLALERRKVGIWCCLKIGDGSRNCCRLALGRLRP